MLNRCIQLRSMMITVVSGVCLLGLVWMAHAQQPGPDTEILRIRRVNINTVRTPEYRTNIPGGRNRPQNWAEILVEYDTAPEWIDELTFQYYVMTEGQIDRQRAFSFYRNTVRYGDIAQGRSHLSSMYLRPAALERFGQVIAVGVEILYDGNVLAVTTELQGSGRRDLMENWWKVDHIINSPAVTIREGYLLNREESPFRLVNISDYEFIK